MKKRIIVPIDFSGDSINALEYAIETANILEADIRMIHVNATKSFEVPFYFKEIGQQVGKSAEDFFSILYDKYKEQIKNEFDYKVRTGTIYQEVTNQAKYSDAHMIIMGTHGASGFEEFFIGSNAYKVVTHAPCPVITVRHGFMRKAIKNIVLPIDITSDSRKKVNFVADLADVFDATVHITAVRETNGPGIIKKLDGYIDQLAGYFKGKKINYETQSLIGDNITEITIDYSTQVNADLIAIMTEQSTSLNNLWLGAYAQQMVNHSPIPVLSIRPNIF